MAALSTIVEGVQEVEVIEAMVVILRHVRFPIESRDHL